MSYQCFDVTITDKIAHVVLNRPDKRNSMSPAFWDELPEIIEDIDRHSRARVIVISSTGPHFSSGLDISMFSDASITPGADAQRQERLQHGARFYDTVLRMQKSFNVLESCRIPVLAAIQGGAIGGGVDLATACDMRYATEDAFFTVFEINIGMTADVGTLQRLPKIIPEGVARELAYTGDRMSAARAREVGLVNEVFDDHESLVAGVLEIAERIATKSPLAIWGTKEMINFTRDHSVADSLRYMAGWQAGMFQPADMMEEFGAKADKRPAQFEELPKRA